jgi:hypothetical protein
LPKRKRAIPAEVTNIEVSAKKILQDFVEKSNSGNSLMLVWVFCLIQAVLLVVIGFAWIGSVIQDIPYKGHNVLFPLFFTALGVPIYFRLKRVDKELKDMRSQVTSLISKGMEQ